MVLLLANIVLSLAIVYVNRSQKMGLSNFALLWVNRKKQQNNLRSSHRYPKVPLGLFVVWVVRFSEINKETAAMDQCSFSLCCRFRPSGFLVCCVLLCVLNSVQHHVGQCKRRRRSFSDRVHVGDDSSNARSRLFFFVLLLKESQKPGLFNAILFAVLLGRAKKTVEQTVTRIETDEDVSGELDPFHTDGA